MRDGSLYSSVAERQSCKLKVLGSIPSGGCCLRTRRPPPGKKKKEATAEQQIHAAKGRTPGQLATGPPPRSGNPAAGRFSNPRGPSSRDRARAHFPGNVEFGSVAGRRAVINGIGLRRRSGPMCTLSQNGYGDGRAESCAHPSRLTGGFFEQGLRDALQIGQRHPWSSGYDVSLTR